MLNKLESYIVQLWLLHSFKKKGTQCQSMNQAADTSGATTVKSTKAKALKKKRQPKVVQRMPTATKAKPKASRKAAANKRKVLNVKRKRHTR